MQLIKYLLPLVLIVVSVQLGPAQCLIPNPSFENYSNCPLAASSVSGFVDDWITGGTGTSDYYNIDVACGFGTISSNWTAPVSPLPGNNGCGDGYIGFWALNTSTKEYVGTVLNAPFVAGTTYQLQYSTAWSRLNSGNVQEITLYGTDTPADLPLNNDQCPFSPGSGITGNWEVLNTSTITYPSLGTWVTNTITFTPVNTIQAILIGPGCASTNLGYYFLDNLELLNPSCPSIDLCVVLSAEDFDFDLGCEDGETVIEWPHEAPSEGYQVKVEPSCDGTHFSAPITLEMKQGRFVDPHPCSEHNYYRVSVLNLNGEPVFSKVLTSECGLGDSFSRPEIIILENSLQVKHRDRFEITLYDLQGRLLQRESKLEEIHVMDVSTLATGFYVLSLRATDNGRMVREKIFVR